MKQMKLRIKLKLDETPFREEGFAKSRCTSCSLADDFCAGTTVMERIPFKYPHVWHWSIQVNITLSVQGLGRPAAAVPWPILQVPDTRCPRGNRFRTRERRGRGFVWGCKGQWQWSRCGGSWCGFFGRQREVREEPVALCKANCSGHKVASAIVPFWNGKPMCDPLAYCSPWPSDRMPHGAAEGVGLLWGADSQLSTWRRALGQNADEDEAWRGKEVPGGIRNPEAH